MKIKLYTARQLLRMYPDDSDVSANFLYCIERSIYDYLARRPRKVDETCDIIFAYKVVSPKGGYYVPKKFVEKVIR